MTIECMVVVIRAGILTKTVKKTNEGHYATVSFRGLNLLIWVT